MMMNQKPTHHFKQAGQLATVGLLGGMVNPIIFTVFSSWLGAHTATLITSGTSASTGYFLTLLIGHFTKKVVP